jgi:hypothetical protein
MLACQRMDALRPRRMRPLWLCQLNRRQSPTAAAWTLRRARRQCRGNLNPIDAAVDELRGCSSWDGLKILK